MKKIASLFTVLCILTVLLPFASASVNYVFTTVGHGPQTGEVGMPLKACHMPGDRLAVLDVSTGLISVFSKNVKSVSQFVLPDFVRESFMKKTLSMDISSGLFVLNEMGISSDEAGNLYLMTDNEIVKLTDDGEHVVLGNFSSEDEMNPGHGFTVDDDGNIYILDNSKCINVMSPKGFLIRSIGEVGSGKGKVTNPVAVRVDEDNVYVLDSFSRGEMGSDDHENAVTVWTKEGKFVTEFAGSQDGFVSEDHLVWSSFSFELIGEKLYLTDIDTNKGEWVLRTFGKNGDFIEKKSIKSNSSNIITSSVFDVANFGGEPVLCQPFLSKIITADGGVVAGEISEESLVYPVSAIATEDGKTLILEGAPPRIRTYTTTGELESVTPLKSETSGLPGLDLTVGADIDIYKDSVYVATGLSVVEFDEKDWKRKSSVDIPASIDDTGVIVAMKVWSGKVFVLDSIGQVTVYSAGLPITFKAAELLDASNLSDVAVDRHGNIYVICPEDNVIGKFSPSGAFSSRIRLAGFEWPNSMCFIESGEMFVLDSVRSKVCSVSDSGEIVYELGEKGMIGAERSKESYAKDPDKMFYPTRIRSNGKQMTILDSGNMRVLNLAEGKEPEPEKKPAKLEVKQSELDWGTVYYPEKIKKVIQLKNIGETPLDGSVSATSEKLELSVSKIGDDTLAVYVTYNFTKADAWKTLEEESIDFKTNGGNFSVKVLPVAVVGKVIEMDIGNPIFRIKTVGQPRDFETSRAPIINNSRTYVPLRALSEALDASIEWIAEERKVVFELEGNKVELWIGKSVAKVNGADRELDSPPIIVDNSTYVPVRFVSEQLGSSVKWHAETRTVEIAYPAMP
ncbi:MAG TPA: stalk domain-containing protein [Caldisericia bacterium]|nr:stalk domain-containing protein [Caldisericia bacterium]HPF48605.1 stalk domain-containing protein [Caldisericia bacterium]HPI83735.1 stalk domain-containing protein [Caldisericia bacterium]HPQ93060.1 stalk domain-containing protein [Caldisericia bacterium]HRV75107.1 stalk domain-containing protein [Caldisericia bacterium]